MTNREISEDGNKISLILCFFGVVEIFSRTFLQLSLFPQKKHNFWPLQSREMVDFYSDFSYFSIFFTFFANLVIKFFFFLVLCRFLRVKNVSDAGQKLPKCFISICFDFFV